MAENRAAGEAAAALDEAVGAEFGLPLLRAEIEPEQLGTIDRTEFPGEAVDQRLHGRVGRFARIAGAAASAFGLIPTWQTRLEQNGMIRKASIIVASMGCMAGAQAAGATGFNAGLGYNFLPRAAYSAVGYDFGPWGFEASVISLGREEPTTKPGPEYSLDLIGYLPWAPMFIKAGPQAGGGHKSGYNFGGGFDIPLAAAWSVRVQETHFSVREDQDREAESENLFSVGIRYQF